MKRLIDETSDDLTHSLLQAGIDHRPPPGSQARLLVALGAGSALGLTTSKALGFWSTSAGKLTLVSLSVGVGLTGAVYAVSAGPGPERATAALQAAPAETVAAAPVAPLVSSEAPVLDRAAPEPPFEGPAAVAPPEPEPSGAVASDHGAGIEQPVPSRRRRAERQIPNNRAPQASAKISAPSEESAVTPVASLGLDTEVEWVDAMRSAVRHGDRANLAGLVERYRAAFPEGQLRQEVADLANRL